MARYKLEAFAGLTIAVSGIEPGESKSPSSRILARHSVDTYSLRPQPRSGRA